MIPFLQARWFTACPGGRIIDLLVVHSMEGPEGDQSAESCARYFANHPGVDSRGKPSFPSAHVCGDNNSRVRCVLDRDVANAAPGANHNGLHYEFPGTATQTRDQWLDPYGQGALDQGAAQFAEWVTAYDLPVRFVDHLELLAGQVSGTRVRGITTHAAVARAFGRSTHWDPGPGFPMDDLLARIRARLVPAPPSQEETMYLVRNTETQGIHVLAEKTGVGPNVGDMAVVEELEAAGVVTKAPNGQRWADLSPEAFEALPTA